MKKLLLLAFLPVFVYANIAKITSLSGDVTIKRDTQTLVAKVGTSLQKNDFISTKKNAKAQILFSDKTVFTIGKNSTLDIAEYLYDETQPSKNKAQFNVLKGAFSSITGRIGKLNKSKFKLKTKSASIGIRGTIVKANQDEIFCTEGAITVITENGVSVTVEAGEKTIIKDGIPSVPVAISKTELEKINSESGSANSSSKGNNTQSNNKSENQTITLINTSASQQDAKDSQKNETLTKELETRKDITFKGRTIETSGNQESITIKAQNIQDQLSLEDSGLTMVNDHGEKVDSISSDNVITWGYWNSDISKKWVAGQETDVKVMEELQTSTNTVNAVYQGKVMGTVNGTDDIKMDDSNNINLNFSLGQNKNTMDGSINFQTQSNQQWSTNMQGSVSGNSFSSTSVSGGNVDAGTVDGKFYGSDAQSAGGTFNLIDGQDKATGVFKADKQ